MLLLLLLSQTQKADNACMTRTRRTPASSTSYKEVFILIRSASLSKPTVGAPGVYVPGMS